MDKHTFELATVGNASVAVLLPDRRIRVAHIGNMKRHQITEPVPGEEFVAAIGPSGSAVLMRDGTVYVWNDAKRVWQTAGNVFVESFKKAERKPRPALAGSDR